MAEAKYDDEGNLVGDDYRPIVRESAPAKKTAAKKTARRAKKASPPAPVEEPTPSDAPAETGESA